MHGPFINIKVKVMGEFVSPNSPVTVNVTINKPLIIKCPEHTYTYGVFYSWLNVSTRANPNFDPKRVVMDTTNGTLYFSEVITQDLIDFAYAKGIQCRMMMGEINSKFSNHVFLSKIGLFTKPEPPGSFNYPTSDVSKFVTVGDFTDLHCFPYGSSPITISWFKDSKQITTTTGIYALQNNNRTLRISTFSNDTVGTYHAVIQSGSSRIQLSKIKIHYFQLLGDFVAAEQKGSVIFDCTLAFFLSGVSNLPFKWYYNGVPVNSDKFGSRYKLHSNGSFSLSQLSPLDTGIYQCFIDGRLANARILFVTGLPLPPTKLTITNCSQRTTNLTWQVIKTPSYPVKSFVVEMSSLFTPTIFTTLLKVDNAIQSVELKDLTPWASLRFRVRGKVDVGIGLPSMPSQPCITPQGLPTKYPDKLTATPDVPDGSIKLRWKIFPEIDWNGAGCGFLFFAKPNNTKTWKQSNREPIPCTQTETVLRNLGTYQLTDVKVQVRNNAGSGPESPAVTSYSGQPRPSVAPKNVVFTKVTENSVALKWDAIVLKGGSVDEYMIVYQSGNIQQPARRRRSILTRKIDKWHDLIAMVSRRQRVRRAVGEEAEPSPPKQIRTKNTYITISGLKPYVLQTVIVSGVNSGGPGFSTTVRTTTLSATYKFFSVAIKFINVTFTAEYKDSLSLPYKRLKETINNGLDVLFKNNFFAESFEVLSFRNGSVVADIQVVGKSPMGQEISKPLKAMKPDLFSPYQFDSNITFSVEPDFMPPNVSVSNGFPASGDTIEFKCVFILGPRNSSFYWVKDKRQITPGVRHSISHTGLESILGIRKIQPGDEGLYQCGVGKLKFNVSVLSPAYLLKVRPVVSIEPRSLTKVQGESASFSCKVVSGDISKMRFLIVRPKPDFQVFSYNGAITLTGLEITNGNDSQVMLYQCLLVLKETFNISNPSIAASPVAQLTIVKPSVPKCLQESSDNILWLDTAAGSIDIQRCPRNATGSATRRCTVGSDNKPKWAEPDFGNCTSVVFYNLLLQAEAITSEDYKPTYNASELLNVLENATKSRNLYGGDLSVTVQILQMLTNYNQDTNGTKVTSDKDQQNFVGICSNCLELTNSKRWIQYEDQVEKGTRSLWNRLVVTVDNYGLQLTNQIESSNKLIQTPNIAMRLDKVNLQNQVRRNGLRFRYKDFGSSLYLPPSVFENSQDHRVVSLVYRTLNVVMRLQNDTNGTSASSGISANTTMVTSVVSPPPTGKLNSKVKIVLQNKRVVEPVPPRTCVFWKVGLPATWKTDGCELVTSESNKEITTCECDHLTVFASLMDPYGGPIGEKDRRALELISTIGCAISLVAVLLTIIITVFFWRSVKSPRTIVLINICVAIAVVCILVISEGSARQSKVGCIVLAVLLHYFLLAVFCWMLCEGILLYYLIVKVIGAKVEEKIKYFLLFGWGFPLLVVAISLGATQTKGYGDHGDNTACWLSVDNGLIWAFVGPALFVLLINIIVFILVIRQMMGTRHVQSKSRDEKLRMGVKATAVILPLLGITWLFGLLAFNSSTLAFKYIFAIFNSLQGLMIFIFHCLLNQQIKDAVKRKYNKYSSSDSTGSGVPRGKSSPSKNSLGLEKQSGTLPSTLPRNSYEMTSKKKDSKSEELLQSVSEDKHHCHHIDEFHPIPKESFG